MMVQGPARGRPVDAAKRAAVLTAAQQLFSENGFAGTSMDSIAKAAGATKLTVYRNFGSKQDLFAEAIRLKCETMLAGDSRMVVETDPRTALAAFGRAFLRLIHSEEALGVHRLIVAERERSPGLGQLFHDNAIEPTRQRLAALLDQFGTGGPQPQLGARDLLILWRGWPAMHFDLNLPPLSQPELDSHVDHCVDLCLTSWTSPNHHASGIGAQ
jgi:TetR/AcrR family transcriptional regulator, mexJK operon transcriptional repressor